MSDSVVNPLNYDTNADVVRLLPIYQVIRDVIEGNVKSSGTSYLPMFYNEVDMDRNRERWGAYHSRAIFYNFLARTLIGFVGQIYSRDPEIKVPAVLDILQKDANGDGLTLLQLSKEACAEVLSLGRFGILVDYPNTGGSQPTKEQVDAGEYRAVLLGYKTEAIVNWAHKKRGAKKVLAMVVLLEDYEQINLEKMQVEIKKQTRTLYLDNNNVYRQRIEKEDGNPDEYDDFEVLVNGSTVNEIPFTFIGAINNDANVDEPPMRDMADINIGHYRNSADYEESVFLIGQPTLVVTGLDEKWYEKVLKSVIRFGSRNGINLNKDADAKLLQAEPNTLAKEAMDAKQTQLAAMGAEFLREQSVQKTATEADINDAARTSSMSNAASNVSAAIQFALEWAALFEGASESEVVFKLNTQFDLTRMTEAERMQLMKEWQAGAISWTEYRSALHKAGIASEDDNLVQKENEEKEAADLERMAKEFDITNPAVQPGAEE